MYVYPQFPFSSHPSNPSQFGNPQLNGGGGWGIFNAILGWQNSATYGSVISYNVYWIFVILGFLVMRYREATGHLPFLRAKRVEYMEDSGTSSGVFESASGSNEKSIGNTVGVQTFPEAKQIEE
jgi:high-affinity iron transporter